MDLHCRKLNNRLNNIHGKALRIVFRDYKTILKDFSKQNRSVSIDQTNLKIVVTVVFEKENDLKPVIMLEVFKFKAFRNNF